MKETLTSLREENAKAYHAIISEIIRLLDFERFRKAFEAEALPEIVDRFPNELCSWLEDSAGFDVLKNKLRDEIREELYDEILDEIGTEIRDEIRDELTAKSKEKLS